MSIGSNSDNSFIQEAMPAFVSEAREQCDAMEQLLLQLEDAPGDRDLLDALFRCAHTIKGSAGIFGLDGVVAFTHHVESLLDQVRAGDIALTPRLSTLLLQCRDAIRELIDGADGADAAAAGPASQAARAALVLQLQAAGAGSAGQASCPATTDAQPAPNSAAAVPGTGAARWDVAVRFGADTFRDGMDPLTILNYLRGLGTLTTIDCDTAALPSLENLNPETCCLGFAMQLETAATRAQIESAFAFVRDDCDLQVEPAATEAEQPRPGTAQEVARTPPGEPAASPLLKHAPMQPARAADGAPVAGRLPVDDSRFIRVQADRLDAVINLLGELVIAGAGAALLARHTRQGALIEANLQIGRLIEEIRNGTLQLRMVPIGETFARFRRVIRDTAGELGKEVQLEIAGGETELDKSVVERIADPLMHLVRNALDHGLEPPAERLAAGKPALGRLTLAACHEAGSIVIRISDDGRGIQRRKVLERAWERGLVETGVEPAPDEIDRLIFAAGFSTAEKVTSLSGRGVGMDVVRRNIEALRGSVALHSREGEGSTIEIRLPLTLAIIDGFLVGVGASKFIFPLDAVVEVIECRPAATVLDRGGRGVVELRGQVLPVVSLRRLYALPSAEPERSSVVVLQVGARRIGVMVDVLLGQHQTVIKPLGRMFRSLRGMSGSSILGNGEVALIFDVASLAQLAAEPPGSEAPVLRGAPTDGSIRRSKQSSTERQVS